MFLTILTDCPFLRKPFRLFILVFYTRGFTPGYDDPSLSAKSMATDEKKQGREWIFVRPGGANATKGMTTVRKTKQGMNVCIAPEGPMQHSPGQRPGDKDANQFNPEGVIQTRRSMQIFVCIPAGRLTDSSPIKGVYSL